MHSRFLGRFCLDAFPRGITASPNRSTTAIICRCQHDASPIGQRAESNVAGDKRVRRDGFAFVLGEGHAGGELVAFECGLVLIFSSPARSTVTRLRAVGGPRFGRLRIAQFCQCRGTRGQVSLRRPCTGGRPVSPHASAVPVTVHFRSIPNLAWDCFADPQRQRCQEPWYLRAL